MRAFVSSLLILLVAIIIYEASILCTKWIIRKYYKGGDT